MSNADYLNGLAAWVRAERERLSIAGDFLSCDELSARFVTEAGKSVSGETLRRWEAGKGKRRIDEDKEQAIAAYCRATNQPIPDWLQPAIKPSEEVDLAQLLEFINQASPADAAKISAIVTEGIRWLVAHGYGPKPRPQSIEAFHTELLTHTQAIASATEMPPERIQAIVQGDWPTAKEIMALASYWGPDNEWLTDLIRVAKGGSGTGSTTDRRAKSKQRQPPGDKA